MGPRLDRSPSKLYLVVSKNVSFLLGYMKIFCVVCKTILYNRLHTVISLVWLSFARLSGLVHCSCEDAVASAIALGQ